MGDGPLVGRHVLLGVSGGIAAYKAAELARELIRAGATVQAILTQGAASFVGPATFEGLTGRRAHVGVFEDPHRILHVRLAREADVAVFAPATANLLAKFASGIADDLVTSTYTCLTCPVIAAPAMHTEMWEHPATRANVARLASWGVRIIGPEVGQLAGGDEGPGRLSDPGEILAAAAQTLVTPEPDGSLLAGLRLVVTAGGTREPIDPVRYIGNRSSGKMGYALAAEAQRRGATVDLISGPSHLEPPPGVSVSHVETALQMRDAVVALADKADVVIKAAAVADFRPVDYHEQKLKKDTAALASVILTPNPDILAELGARPHDALLVGFAAETDLEEERGREKLHRKGLDLIVINRVDMADSGFNVDTNRALLLTMDGRRREVPLTTKAELASVICDEVEALIRMRAP
ncbi:MAG: bifunctional phosphopantothenoylcysteine decarboxylase/phosphopantothenate--cysteine ligase CoaBC [Nitriliruptorales bacterium]|nr:bifunctional phosphopantothenoylcysteine decarboxylase/phosphopantothenate--cysteine ligase CoaBC [Nitriliruptorales bacterium]